MAENTKNIFFLGKGGVGKSTSSALTAIHLAEKGKKTLLVSLDPAHNQSDIFEQNFSEKSVKINENLSVKEVDTNIWVNKYLKDVQLQVKHTYSYLTAFNLENYLDVIKYSPGIEEYALLMAFKSIRDAARDEETIIFDMPPTALSLKFLSLPNLSLKWLKNLLDLRNKIIEKRKIITKIKLGNKEIERDKILNKLNKQISDYKSIKDIFENQDITQLNLVLNTDKLSFSESQLILDYLSKFNIQIKNIFLNKCPAGFDSETIEKEYSSYGFQKFPESAVPLIGIKTLSNYLENITDFIDL